MKGIPAGALFIEHENTTPLPKLSIPCCFASKLIEGGLEITHKSKNVPPVIFFNQAFLTLL